ncbi:MAG: ABC transporter, permease protein 1 (cluster 11, riboflavin/purine nucleoside/unknown) [uncultured Acidimicrobiales bacterium]|uniref:Nucleoside ABC transporter, permease protein 1 n=1 Tax=uncultured Acidimicrobiales bacterium TaxID=310071 RepID=A0A6J4HK78_9ACTN|nr:MAG: ABC transporter, permease protein 1 (cluster 11, riboflavin/purine nucleoside/unknown) [uncultured Acidimicrobiales bacterium]
MSAALARAGRVALVPALAIFSALAVGGLIIVVSDSTALRDWSSFVANPGRALSTSWDVVSGAYGALFRTSLGGRRAISETLLEATPLVLTGLSVTFAFRAGLFNIGGDGQFLAGALTSVYVGFSLDIPAALHLPLALAAGVAAGALWGGIAGVLKARTGAHEVITTIMLNFVALRLVDYALSTDVFRRTGRSDPISKQVLETARLPRFSDDLRVHAGLVLALVTAYGVWWLLFRSTTGFRVRAVGASPSAARYAGMAVGGTWVLSMLVAGGLAGLAGATTVLGVRFSLTGGFSNLGFDAIALALLGRSHPAGVVAAALLFGVLRAGATGMAAEASTPVDIIVVIQALVIVFVAAPSLIRSVYRIGAGRGTGPVAFSSSWGS